MNMKKIIFFLCAMACMLSATAKDGNSNTVKATLAAVTVYRVGAEMHHQAKATLVKGNSELIIEDISNALDVNSIQVTCNGSVTVMGVEFNTDYLKEELKTPAVKLLEDSAERINAGIEKNKTSINIVAELLSVLKANKEIKGTQTGLSVAELIKMMEYYKTKSAELQNELAALNLQQSRLAIQLEKVIAQVTEEQKKNTKITGRIVLQLNNAISGKYDFEITYITPNAYWSPFYDLRTESITAPLKLVYRSKIFQSTGIDWKQVKLSLSTAVPNQNNNAPLFNVWFLSYINPVNYYNKSLSIQNTIVGAAPAQLNEVVVVGYGSAKKEDMGETIPEAKVPVYIVNGNEMPVTEFRKIRTSAIKNTQVLKENEAISLYGSRGSNGVVLITLKDGLDDYISISDKELDVVFDIDLPFDVPTNGKAQTAVLKEYTIPVAYQFYAVPKLDKEVFLLAQIPDWEKLNLLPGEANIIFEGTYTGKSFIDPSSIQDTLNLTMGKDKRVAIKREKLKDFSTVKFLSSGKKEIFTYETTVKNNKKDSIGILLKDQYPISQNKEVEVELLQSDNAVINVETGVLNWTLKLAPGESKKVRISYSVKYPRDKVLNL